MFTLLWITSFALLIMETFTGLVANGFIVFVNWIDWFRRRKLSPTDMILTCLGLSRLIWQATIMTYVVMTYFSPYIYSMIRGSFVVSIIWLFTDNLNLWFATWLSVLYFVKIATFSHPIFLQMKLQFLGRVPWVLLSSVVFSAFMTIIATTGFHIIFGICDHYKLNFNNSCDSETERHRFSRYNSITLTAVDCMPSVIFVSSITLLIVSLWRHIRHLQCTKVRIRDQSTKIHLSAIKALVSFAVLYLSSFGAITMHLMLPLRRKDHVWTAVFFHNVSALYPSVHAIILILINPKLKQAWVRMIQHLKCPLRETRS